MIYMITIILTSLVLINFILLKFSCNKTVKRHTTKRPVVSTRPTQSITTRHAQGQLAPTGS